MTIPEVFIASEKALLNVVNQIKDEQWDKPASEELARGKELTLREIINYHAFDDSWVTDVLAGKTIAEVGDKYAGDLLGDDPKASYSKINAVSQAAVEALKPEDLDKTVHLSYGDFPIREYLKHITSYRGFQAWSIAREIGVDTTLPADLVQGMWDVLIPEIEDWRKMGVFGPPVEEPADANLQTKLLCATGFYLTDK